MDNKIKQIQDGAVHAVSTVVPYPLSVEDSSWIKAPFQQKEIGVLVSMTGDVKVRMFLEETSDTFASLGQSMYGMALEDQMLESFVGELGNMIAGTLSSYLYERGYTLDITPPTVMVGQTKLFGFEKGLLLPVGIEGIGKIAMLLIVEDN